MRGEREAGKSLFAYLEDNGVLCDWREPDVIRMAPVPLYNHYEDIYRFIKTTQAWAGLTLENGQHEHR